MPGAATQAALLTGQASAALATMAVHGPDAARILRLLFQPASARTPALAPGEICLGTIRAGDHTIDQVTLGCEGRERFAIHCHGNPLIVEQIMALLANHGATLLPADRYLSDLWRHQGNHSTIAVEARQTLLRAKTLAGSHLLYAQIKGGLSAWVTQWQDRLAPEGLSILQRACSGLLATQRPARCLIHGCRVLLVGPPNAGKSTLLNCLCGQERAVVTPLRGTTRDWIEAPCHLGPLFATLIDTAGLEAGRIDDAIDREAQTQTLRLLEQADLILLILDSSQTQPILHPRLRQGTRDVALQLVFNKADLPTQLDQAALPAWLGEGIRISARQESGIQPLISTIQDRLGLGAIDLEWAVCYTDRQAALLQALRSTDCIETALTLLDRLQWGDLRECDSLSPDADD